VPEESGAKARCEQRFGLGIGTYGDIFIEEVAEAIGAANEDRLREELVQCAAVAVAWIEAIDRRKAAGPATADATGVPPARVVYQRHLAVPGYWEDITQEQWEKAPQSDTRVLYTSTAGPVDKHLNGGW
jgi:hypothetical protein